jgi:RNA polymerase sigma factor (sigma-70 family)
MEDVVQAVLLKLQSPHVLEQIRLAEFKMGYMIVMIRNTAHDLARRRIVERDALQRLGQHFVEALEPPTPEEPNREDRLAEQLSRLSSEDRELLTFRFWSGLRIGEIAARRKESYSAVAVRLFRLLRRLEERLRQSETSGGAGS